MGKHIGSVHWRKHVVPPVSAADLRPVEGLRVIDGLYVKEFTQGAWVVLWVAEQEDLRTYPTVTN